ncbi:Major facilitator superfamily protein [Gossypium australe]|uniref:Major facilitator superfamily protein n=1 Tax=Gossypium australe TaxID=47621 RepID=A0A5B6X8P7_9ROSI|nr:Major facilitator superfamily protein [Gossypium australe]
MEKQMMHSKLYGLNYAVTTLFLVLIKTCFCARLETNHVKFCYSWSIEFDYLSDNYLSQYTNYYGNKVTENGLISPRFLNKACVIKNPQQDLTSDGNASNPWSLCTIGQVEELKALIRVIPVWSTGIITGIIIAVTYSLDTFAVMQASTMDRHITPKFDIPASTMDLTYHFCSGDCFV